MMKISLIIFFSLLCGTAVLWLIFKLVISSVRRKMESKALKKFNRKDIIKASPIANYFGRKSRGGLQIRGNGVLVLTKKGLSFTMAFPEKEYYIPIETITGVSLPKSFNGRTIFMPLLQVDFIENGRDESIAWAVKEPKKWKKAIETLLANQKSCSASE